MKKSAEELKHGFCVIFLILLFSWIIAESWHLAIIVRKKIRCKFFNGEADEKLSCNRELARSSRTLETILEEAD